MSRLQDRRAHEKHNILQHSRCPDGHPWIENWLEGGYTCIENECYLDEDGQMYFLRDFEDAPPEHRTPQREAPQDRDRERDRERRQQKFWQTVGAIASSVDRGGQVLISKAHPSRPQLVVSRAEQEEREKERKKSFLGRLFGKKFKPELPEKPDGSRHRSRHTGIEPDGAWTPPPPYQSREKLSSKRESSRHESSRRESSSRHGASRKAPSRRSSSRNESSSRPPTYTSKTSSRHPSNANNQDSFDLPIRSISSSRRRHHTSSSRHASIPPPPLPTASSRHPTHSPKNISIPPPPSPSSPRHPTRSSSSRHPPKPPKILITPAPTTPSHHEELTSWEERQNAQTGKSTGKTTGTIKTELYKLGDMARTILEGQH